MAGADLLVKRVLQHSSRFLERNRCFHYHGRWRAAGRGGAVRHTRRSVTMMVASSRG